jgi:hypothetical protein
MVFSVKLLRFPNISESFANRIDKTGIIIGSVTITSGAVPVAWIPIAIN